ncbi:MAG: type II secretion system F family protein [Syntrophomonadaceae bacterium]
MRAAQIALVIELAAVLLVLVAGSKRAEYREFVARYGESFQLTFMAPAGLLLLDRFQLQSTLGEFNQRVRDKIVRIYGVLEAPQYSRMFLAQAISALLIIPIIVSILVVLGEGGIGGVILGIVLAPVLAYLLFVDLDKKIKAREDAMILELPEFLNKVILLVNAGENVQEAIIKGIESKLRYYQKRPDEKMNPLYQELHQVMNELRNNRSFHDSMEDFSKRCAVHEISVFVSTLLLNYRRGGGEFVSTLKDLSETLWEKRIAVARTLGEEASSKLVFPMVVIFFVVMVIIASPAVMSMNM